MFSNLISNLTRFRRDVRGNVAMLTALSIIPLVGVAGLAMDYSFADSMRTKLASAADAAALAGGQLYTATPAERIARANQVFTASTRSLEGVHIVNVTPADVMSGTSTTGFRIDVTARSETFFGWLFGVPSLPIGVSAEVTSGSAQQLEIALVLDVTGSMSGSKIDALKTAATNLVNSLNAKAATPDQVKFSLVPFANYVSIDVSNRNKPWLDVPPDVSGTWQEYPVTSTTNCRMQTMTGSNDGIPYSYQGEVCDYTYGPPITRTYNDTWTGCVGSRNSPLDAQDGSYTTRIPGLINYYCPRPIIPLTSNASTLTTAINSLSAGGETYIPAGLLWGWLTLSAGEPFAETRKGTIPDKDLKRIVILMTDGANTKSAEYPWHGGNDAAAANTTTATLCANIKEGAASGSPPDGKIGIYTIAFDVTDMTVKNILQACASSPGHYFNATNATLLMSAFEQIGNSLAALRLNK